MSGAVELEAELRERLATAYRVKAEMNDLANEERRHRLAAEAERDALLAQVEKMRGGTDLRADERIGEMIYRALYEHEGGRWECVETRYVWYNAGARLRAMLSARPLGEPNGKP